MHIYIYRERETDRERDRDRQINIYMYIYIYIYIYRYIYTFLCIYVYYVWTRISVQKFMYLFMKNFQIQSAKKALRQGRTDVRTAFLNVAIFSLDRSAFLYLLSWTFMVVENMKGKKRKITDLYDNRFGPVQAIIYSK